MKTETEAIERIRTALAMQDADYQVTFQPADVAELFNCYEAAKRIIDAAAMFLRRTMDEKEKLVGNSETQLTQEPKPRNWPLLPP
jgi:hypothetical protein